MKDKNFIFTLIGLVLVIGLIIGLCVWVARSDGSTKDSSDDSSIIGGDIVGNDTTPGINGVTDTSKPSDTSSSKPSDTSSSTSDSTEDFYQKGDLGYITRNDVTTFFVEVSAKDFTNVQSYCDNLWTANFLDNEIAPSSEYKLAYKYSIDGGETWFGMRQQEGTDMYFCVKNDGERVYVSIEDSILIAYTQIENCKNPDTIYQSLYESVFASKDVFNGCCGAYTYYVDFTIYMFHKSK